MKKAISGSVITFTFDGLEPLTFDTSTASEAVKSHAMLHGFMQRLGDAAAIPRTKPDGSVVNVTEAMRREAVAEIMAHYASGTSEWNLRASAKPAKQNPAILALAAALGKTYEEAEAHIANLALEAITKGE